MKESIVKLQKMWKLYQSLKFSATKPNQKVVITPFKTHEPGNFKLGIDAPKQVSVNRQEIYLRKQEQLKKENTSTDS
ncbi:carbon storage regulator [Legionella sp. 16cNR16C]|uniref:carbon storage regulator n=1 Tax=Legionella sp. 16cNR16C TaxID=2905656 RepID=UPI001E3EE557|nr:carbon storage regulator [Legionella sp. 16cNR16C]MCE3045442.1 carbon storage regulator [Legionella sp. 16cNR16C]